MTKTAFAYWNNRIAPVFDSARRIYLVEIDDSGRIIGETEETLPDDQPVKRAVRLAELSVDTLVCGALSRSLHGIIHSYGIRVVPFVAGELHQIIQAWHAGNLHSETFTMPGCCRCVRSLHGYTEQGKRKRS